MESRSVMKIISRTTEDLKTILKNQIQFLVNSSNAFDNNFEEEAIRMATVIRVMLHDTSRSKSLLGQLGLKNIEFRDSATDYDPNNLVSHHGLVGWRFRGGKTPIYYTQLSERVYRMTFFDEWWEKIVIVDEHNNKFTRKNLILNLANIEGGAHVDLSLKEDWHALTKQNSIGVTYILTNGTSVPLGNVEKHSLRQITYEVIESLNNAM